MSVQDLQKLGDALAGRPKLYVTKNGKPYSPVPLDDYDTDLIEITEYSVFNKTGVPALIYHEWGNPFIDYTTYEVSDFNITWGFSAENVKQHREDFLRSIKTHSPIEIIGMLSDDTFDDRFRGDLLRALADYFNEQQ